MSSEIPTLVKTARRDLSDWLWHFTRRDSDPFETLKQIAESGHVRGNTDSFCRHRCVCLTEMPITEAIRQSKSLDQTAYERFSDYGVGFRKEWILSKGGLPVIYQPDSMLTDLKETSHWRHCVLDPARGLDFTWQREWRVACDRLEFSNEDVIFVVRNNDEAMELATDNWCLDHERDEVYFDVVWSFITHEELSNSIHPSEVELLRTEVDES